MGPGPAAAELVIRSVRPPEGRGNLCWPVRLIRWGWAVSGAGIGHVKGPLWKPGDGLLAFVKAQQVWVRDHPVSQAWWLAAATLGYWPVSSLVRSTHGPYFWLWLAPVLFFGVTLPRLLWFRTRLQRPYRVRPPREETTGSWW
jgi:hypothetical protein